MFPRSTPRLAQVLRTETTGGIVLLAATLAALAWANSPLSGSYETAGSFRFGVTSLGLEMSVRHWASEGLLTVFFFVAGAELKRELVTGELRRPAAAALPVVAAAAGTALPAAVYLAVSHAGGGGLGGWAVPMATDIAFALGVLAVIGSHLPPALRAFLLTLAVVDDLGAILVIAVFFTSGIHWAPLAGALAGLVLFRVLHARLHVRGWYVYVPLAVAVWALTHNSGVHATVAGVAMGMLLRPSAAGRAEHLLRPLSAGVAVPLFALFAAGVTVSGPALAGMFRQPESLGVLLGLFAGKFAGVFGGTYLTARFTRARLDPALAWPDIAGVSALAGIGFTVSLLVTELAFTDPGTAESVKAAVLTGSLAAAAVACAVLKTRDVRYRAARDAQDASENTESVS
ncbi:Na+/H+ antiporter NhaA [Streptomyces sp. HNM0575]|uniref:Na+/H+ antiporter NhaA n=1 Tax=Streptomyces sp. HNM0575 TaxID=2716338 RepID=UPI00145DBFBD|nr:Na+/H+ antiporter NhaA [Streptomyces sp. HNM0575]NLU71337.1 Na+/H+ antiporter NhaA [Streptomyces sp. HNM0575]